MNDPFLVEIEKYITDLYNKNSPAENVYHTLAHVKNVVKLVQDIGKSSGINDDDLEILQIAAWFHDIGHMEIWEGHEELSARYCREYLSSKDYPKERIKKVIGCIIATEIPHEPKNILEQIICDADIAHIGSEDFFEQSNLLRSELENREKINISKYEWLRKNIEFLQKNYFFTKFAKSKFDEIKKTNLDKLEEMFKN